MLIKNFIFYFVFFYLIKQPIALAYTVTPTIGMLNLSESRSLNFSVKNSSNKPIRIEAQAFVNQQDSSGNLNSVPTKSLLLFPPIIRIPPNSSKKLRVVLNPDKDNINEQQAYKILIKGLPEGKSTLENKDKSKDISVSIQIVTAYHVPLYIIPKKPTFSLTLANLKIDKKNITVGLKNESNMTLRLVEHEMLVMIGDNWEKATPVIRKTLPLLVNNTVEQNFNCSVCEGKKIKAVKINGTLSYWGTFSILKNI